jgi:hypothetical protein
LELINKILSDHILCSTQDELASKLKSAGESTHIVSTGDSFQTLDEASTHLDTEWHVTAVVAKVASDATKNQASRKIKYCRWHFTSKSIIKVLLDSGSDGDLLIHEKGARIHFPNLTRQVQFFWHMSHGSILTKGTSKVVLTFIEYLNSWEYTATPDVLEYDKCKMAEPLYEVILG